MHVRIAVIGREHGGNDVSDYILIALLTVVGCTYGPRRTADLDDCKTGGLQNCRTAELENWGRHCSLSTITGTSSASLLKQ